MDLFEQVANEAMSALKRKLKVICDREQVKGVGDVKCFAMKQLLAYA